MPEYSLDFIGQTLLAMRQEMRERFVDIDARFERVDDRLGAVETKLDGTLSQFREELTVTSAMVMRYSSEHIAWGAMERQIKALGARLERVENRFPATE